MDTDPSKDTMGRLLTRHVRRLFVSSGVVTAVAYVLIRVACDVFYGPLGLAPEDVGISGSELLWRAAGIVALTLVIAVVLAMLPLEILGLFGGGERRSPWVYLVWPAIVAAAVLVSSNAGALMAFAVLVAGGTAQVGKNPPSGRWVTGLTIYGLVVAALSAGTVYAAAIWDRNRVVDGRGLDSLDRTLLPWDATVAELYWTAATPAPKAIADLRCVIYLGSNGSTAIVVDPRGKEATVLRVPASDVTVRTHFDTESGDLVCKPSGVVRTER